MSCEWLRGRWSWPPLESDPAVFQSLSSQLLGAEEAGETSGATGEPLRDLLVAGGGGVAPPYADEVLSFDDLDEALGSSRAVLVCFHSQALAPNGPSPSAAACAAAQAQPAEDGAFFMKQVMGLDAACGIIGLVHALLNADGLLGPGAPALAEGPLARYLESLPAEASPEQRGRALVADRGVRAVYRVQAARGQSRMPQNPLWATLSSSSLLWGCLGTIGVACWTTSIVLLGIKKGALAALAYLGASLLWLLLWYLLCDCRGCKGRRTNLECHFVCLAQRSGRVLLLDGLLEAPQDVGACGGEAGAFAAVALAFVRGHLLPALARPDTCSIIALRPASLS